MTSVYEPIPPDSAHTPPENAVANYDLAIVLLSVAPLRQADGWETRQTFMLRATAIILDYLRTSSWKASTLVLVNASDAKGNIRQVGGILLCGFQPEVIGRTPTLLLEREVS